MTRLHPMKLLIRSYAPRISSGAPGDVPAAVMTFTSHWAPLQLQQDCQPLQRLTILRMRANVVILSRPFGFSIEFVGFGGVHLVWTPRFYLGWRLASRNRVSTQYLECVWLHASPGCTQGVPPVAPSNWGFVQRLHCPETKQLAASVGGLCQTYLPSDELLNLSNV